MMLKKELFYFITICFILSMPIVANAQWERSVPIDTIESNGQKIVLYNDNVWTTLAKLEDIARDKTISDTSNLFLRNWNDITFAYMDSKNDYFPDTISLILLDGNRKFVQPIIGGITSGFGWRSRRAHKGIDIGLDVGTPIRASFDGKVRYAKYNTGGYGNLIIIRHFNGLETYYAHLSKIYVEKDQMVKAGDVIGGGGNTGAPWAGPHLHFECRYFDSPFDPMKIMRFDSIKGLSTDTLLLTANDFKINQSHKAYLNNAVNGDKSELLASNNTSGVNSYKPVYHKGSFHVVKKGDTLSSIARAYGTSVDRLCSINGIRKNSVLQLGQKIKFK